jgi:DHA2 family multidrug resistance protein
MSPIAREAMGNATSLFNLMRNIGGSVGIALVTTIDTRLTQKYVNRLGENVTPFDPNAMQMLERFRSMWNGAGSGPGLSDQQSIASMFGLVQRHAAMLAFVELFRGLALVFLLMIPLLLIMKKPPKGAKAEAGH